MQSARSISEMRGNNIPYPTAAGRKILGRSLAPIPERSGIDRARGVESLHQLSNRWNRPASLPPFKFPEAAQDRTSPQVTGTSQSLELFQIQETDGEQDWGPMLAWIADSCLNKDSADPLYLYKHDFPPPVLKQAVLYAMEFAYDSMACYNTLATRARDTGNKQLAQLARRDLEDLCVMYKLPIIDFWKLSERQIRDMDLTENKARQDFKTSLAVLCTNVFHIWLESDKLEEEIEKYEAKQSKVLFDRQVHACTVIDKPQLNA